MNRLAFRISFVLMGGAFLFALHGHAIAIDDFSAEVVSVPAGHLLQFAWGGGKESAILHGIECPGSTTLTGEAAKQFTREKALNQTLQFHVMKRASGFLYVQALLPSGEDLGEALLRNGLGMWDREVAPEEEKLGQLEIEAKLAKKGVWAQSDLSKALEEEAQKPELAAPGHGLDPITATGEERLSQVPGVARRAYVDEDGVVNLQLKGNQKKTHNFEVEVQNRIRAQRAQAEAERQRQLQAAIAAQMEAEAMAAEEDEAAAYEAYLYQIELEQRRLNLEAQDLYNEYLYRRLPRYY
ncbi:MAG: thermonuclease family protein [Candidatus Hydrogenedentes bacterium]|nr:thermonuclease family protein [Candidatus Hydrogenedentota bacterium]